MLFIYLNFDVYPSEIVILSLKVISMGLIIFDLICVRRKTGIKECLMVGGISTFFNFSTHFALISDCLSDFWIGPNQLVRKTGYWGGGSIFVIVNFLIAVILIFLLRIKYIGDREIKILPRRECSYRIKYQAVTLLSMMIILLIAYLCARSSQINQLRDYLEIHKFSGADELRSMLFGSQRTEMIMEYLNRYLVGKGGRFLLVYGGIGTIINIVCLYLMSKLSKMQWKYAGDIFLFTIMSCIYLSLFLEAHAYQLGYLGIMSIWPAFIYFLASMLKGQCLKINSKGMIKLIGSIFIIKYMNAISSINYFISIKDNINRNFYEVGNYTFSLDPFYLCIAKGFIRPVTVLIIEMVILFCLIMIVMNKKDNLDENLSCLGILC